MKEIILIIYINCIINNTIVRILTSYAFYFGITGKAYWTTTLFDMAFHFTFGIYAAGCSHVTRIQALSIQANVR